MKQPGVKRFSAAVFKESKFRLGEGAIWDPQFGLVCVDILGRRVHMFGSKGSAFAMTMPSDVGTVVPTSNHSILMVALQSGFAKVNVLRGTIDEVVRTNTDPTIRFNDGKCAPDGSFWAGTMGYDARANAGALYALGADLSVATKITGVTISNGIAWSRDAKTMYYIDTPTSKIDAFDYDIATNAISNRRVLVSIPTDIGYPDGMTIDAEGNLWVALWGGGCVANFEGKTGAMLALVEVPGAQQITSCAFGGRKHDRLYITSAWDGLSEKEKLEQPNAGHVFVVDVGMHGVECLRFRSKKNTTDPQSHW